MKKYHVIFPNPNGEGNRIYGLVKTETMGLRMARMGKWGGRMKGKGKNTRCVEFWNGWETDE